MSGLNGQHSGRAGMLSGVAAAIAGMTLNWASSPGNGTPPGFTNSNSSTNRTYYDSNGVLQTAAANVLRETYAWNGSAWVFDGTIVEPQAATNLVTDIRDMTTANWTRLATITVALTGTGADNTANSCSRLTGGAVAATNRVSQTLVAAASQRVYGPLIKRVTGTGPILITQDGFVTTTDVSSQINSTTFTQVKINGNTLNAAYGVEVSTNGDVILVDGNQFETGTDPTSTILNNTIRNADVVTATTSGLLVNAQGFAAIGYRAIAGESTDSECIITTYSGSGGIPLRRVSTALALFDGTANRAFGLVLPNVAGTAYKAATTWGGSACNGAVNGVVGTPAAFDGSMDLGATLRIGDNVSGVSLPLSMVLQSLRLGVQTVNNSRLANPFA